MSVKSFHAPIIAPYMTRRTDALRLPVTIKVGVLCDQEVSLGGLVVILNSGSDHDKVLLC
jgi:hypothetical protein